MVARFAWGESGALVIAASLAASFGSNAAGSKDGELLMASTSFVWGSMTTAAPARLPRRAAAAVSVAEIERGADVLALDELGAGDSADGGGLIGFDDAEVAAGFTREDGILRGFDADRTDAVANPVALAGALCELLRGEFAGIADDMRGGAAERMDALRFEIEDDAVEGIEERGGGIALGIGDGADGDTLVGGRGSVHRAIDLRLGEAEGDERTAHGGGWR